MSPTAEEIGFHCSKQFIPIMQHLNAALLVSTYKLGKVAIIQTDGAELLVDFKSFEQAMGVAASRNRLAVGTRRSIWTLNAERNPNIPNRFSKPTNTAYIARQNHITGNIAVHDLAWEGDRLWLVNTLFSCICTLDNQHNFVPTWKPDCISELAPQDRCHLNGLAVDSTGPRYVSLLAKTNKPEGWRDHKVDGGCIVDVRSGEDVASGLCMPHSPRLYREKLYFLNSGHGSLVQLSEDGKPEEIDRVPGYTRGLSFAGQFAFVGMSQIRESNVFGGLPIGEKPEQLRCGIAVVDLSTGKSVAWFEFKNGVEEIFAVEVIPNSFPALLHNHTLEGDDKELWIIPQLNEP
ncbi:MAG: TIGR03032 family protein [Pirellulaceae bacterium]